MCWKLVRKFAIISFMKYAVVAVGGKQYKVSEGDMLDVDFLNLKPKDSYAFSDVLLFVDDKKRSIGTPILSNVLVKATVVDNKKGEKIRVAKFKSKVRYRRVMGFRARLTTLKIESISSK